MCELTVLFHHLGYQLGEDPQRSTHLDYHRKLRHAIVLLGRADEVQTTPGEYSASLAKAAGRTMPQGSVVGATVFIDDAALVHLARVFSRGGRTLATWDAPLL